MNDKNTITFELNQEEWFPLWRHKNLETGNYVHSSAANKSIATEIAKTIKNEQSEQSIGSEEIKLPRWHK